VVFVCLFLEQINTHHSIPLNSDSHLNASILGYLKSKAKRHSAVNFSNPNTIHSVDLEKQPNSAQILLEQRHMHPSDKSWCSRTPAMMKKMIRHFCYGRRTTYYLWFANHREFFSCEHRTYPAYSHSHSQYSSGTLKIHDPGELSRRGNEEGKGFLQKNKKKRISTGPFLVES
jgi:hypothetical protein